ncbi:protein SAR DEFICIENT 1 [Prunus yedoensis var. nudiflora]|uniref:Protein SAR DEFICIENT 1 n=1 Tax=Prunus yedoensis var. nudiflora TaxID=2094558 RepID=A0A314Z1E0_PRUYE|nr:protein SAR DEFICIENT 1 [Prunus yedoensis var. nudiflora]
MAAKRFFNDAESDQDQPNEKRKRPRPSFASVIGEVVLVNSMQSLFSSLEPLLRRVVSEEVDHCLRRCSLRPMTRSPSMRIQALEPSSVQLVFPKKLSLPIFTASKILDEDNNPIQIQIVDKTNNTNGAQMLPIATDLPNPIKVEIVVLDGDFPTGGRDDWTTEEFENNILRERTGKRPLLTGDVNVTVRDGLTTIGEIEFTDNSSWIRSRKFRLGARVAPGTSACQGSRIREAITDAFVVKDHRGELYKKHHPPTLEDEVWRLEKIGKEGAFHKKLASENIHTVQDFLKLFVVDRSKLRKILGVGMSEKMWEVTVKHARTCVLGNKMFIYRSAHFALFLNPICQVLKAIVNGQVFPTRELSNINRTYIENLVREAYANWNSLEMVDAVLNDTALLTQGDHVVEQYPNHHVEAMSRSAFDQNGHLGLAAADHHSKSVNVGYLLPSNSASSNFECSNGSDNWNINSPYLFNPFVESSIIKCSISDSSSDGDLL